MFDLRTLGSGLSKGVSGRMQIHALKKSGTCKRKLVSSYLGILYLTPEIPNPYFNLKLRWRKNLPLAPHN